jgi:uncharacterized protein YgiM (DUF1202 family)
VSNSLGPQGALVDVKVVDAIRTASYNATSGVGGLVWMRPQFSEEARFTGLLMGDVTVRDVTPPDFPTWQSIVVESHSQPMDCATAPHSAFIAQSVPGQSVRMVINGASLDLNGTLLVYTQDLDTWFVMVSGQMRILAIGQTQDVYAGQQANVRYNPGDFALPVMPPSVPQPLDFNTIRNLPVALLDRPVLLPQPGFVATEGAVNLRSSPSTQADLILQVPPGQVLTVLGRNTAGDWYHVQLPTGETGWMFAELLARNVGSIQAIYERTPQPPQRFGMLAQRARVNAPLGVFLRAAPDMSFNTIGTLDFGVEVELLARSPYSPWVKVQAGETVGWLALLVLDTQAVIEALPIDYDVPPQPGPTPVPGSHGNAFPDPDREGG